MERYIKILEKDLSKVSNGYKEIEKTALNDFRTNDKKYIKNLAYTSDIYQVRMYSVFLFGYLSQDEEVLKFLKEKVSQDTHWRVQEILAKSFDEFCKNKGYDRSLTIIDEWLQNENPNTRRAATEGLRIWTGRPYFKEYPKEAIKRLSKLRQDKSEYVRKSVGNALKDISKKYPELIIEELNSWELESKEIKQVYRLARKFIDR